MMFNPIVALVHNTATSRWHPILFSESPLPGPDDPAKPVRHRSRGHHTVGFDTREAAVADATAMKEKLKEHSLGEPKLALTKDFEWDGQDVPALTSFFLVDSNNNLVPVL